MLSVRVPEGLEDVFKYPAPVAELLSRGWTDAEVKATLGDNLLSVFREVERVSMTVKVTHYFHKIDINTQASIDLLKKG